MEESTAPASEPRPPRGTTPTVFLSAATLDLKSWRDHLDEAFRRAGFRVLTQDQSLRSAPGDVRRLLVETVDEADCVIHLAGMAYGTDANCSFPSDLGFRCSWTQFEYYHAHEKKKDVIAFVCAPDLSAPFTEKADSSDDLIRKQQSQMAHRHRIEKGTFIGTPLEQFTAADGTPLRTSNETVSNPGKLLSAVAAAVGTLRSIAREHRESAERELKGIAAKLEDLEQQARRRHRVVMAAIVALAILGVIAALWIARSQNKGVAKVEGMVADITQYVADPVNLRKRMEQKIEQCFREKHAALLAAKAPYAEVDDLFRWHDRVRSQTEETIAFITARAGEQQSTIIRQAAQIFEEKGTDAALEFLAATLKSERQQHREKGRHLAEASVVKAALHSSRFETDEQEGAIREAIADAPDWFLPHNQLGAILHERGQWQLAEKEYEAARQFMPIDAAAIVLNNLAMLFKDTNRLKQAEPLMERALKIDEQRFGAQHPDVARDLNNLADLYKDTNRPAEAEPLMVRALNIAEKNCRPDDPRVAIHLSALGLFYFTRSRLPEAEPFMERALKIDKGNYGQEHPTVAIRLTNLAALYKATNRLTEAEPLMKQALKIDEKSYGPEHPTVARDLNNLAALYYDTNRLTEAEPLMERALKIDEKSYGPEHPAVARDLNNLGQFYRETNRLTEAESFMERALKIDEKSNGPEHPDVARDLNSLAGLYQATNRLAEAEALVQRALKIHEKTYGPEHPAVANSLIKLGGLYLATNRLVEAEPLLERALKIDKKAYGSDHPDVVRDLGNLGSLYYRMNRLAEAAPLLQITLQFDEKTFGPDHPKVATDLNNLGVLEFAMNRQAEAEPRLRRAMIILLKSTRSVGHVAPNLQRYTENYFQFIMKTSLPASAMAERLSADLREAGYTEEEFYAVTDRLSK